MDDKRTHIKEALMNLLQSRNSSGCQYVTFSIAQEEYGIDIQQVQEITPMRSLTHLPNSPDFIKGVLNLRGHIIPVIDPFVKFHLPQTQEHSLNPVIIIFLASSPENKDEQSSTEKKQIGLIVDRISDVLTIEAEMIQETPDLSMNIETHFIQGVGKVSDRFVIILNVNNIVLHQER